MDYKSISEIAKEWGISIQRVQLLCKQGRIDGAKMVGKVWIIPAGSEKPLDRRIKSGKYIKSPD